MRPDDANREEGNGALTMTTRNGFRLLLAALLVAFPGCQNLTSPNVNFGDLDELETSPDRASLATAAQGLIIGHRLYHLNPNRLVSMLGILGRESYNHDIADPRFESEMLGGELQGSSPAFGGNFWTEPYRNIRLADLVLKGADAVTDAEVSAGEKEALRGFAKTIQALDFLTVVNTRDTNCGCAILIAEDVRAPAPEATREQLFDHIVQLLEEARGHLQNATSFPFRLSSGFRGFDTPATFLQFNRAIRARVAVYTATLLDRQGEFNTALEALAQSFLDPAGDLRTGVFHTFTPGSGDETNNLFQPGADPNLRAHPSIKFDAELKPGGAPDDRFVQKTRTIVSRAFNGVLCTGFSQFPVCDVGFDIYTSTTAPIPIIRNEELILLRAEANIGLGNLPAAQADINLIRDRAGGLPPVALGSQQEAIDQLLYNRRFSLLYEGGYRWIDMRRYDRLDELPLDVPGHRVSAQFPIPLAETAARQ